jgi:4-cresol dehydrogenase (hydroxylating) flavoprotein subunit
MEEISKRIPMFVAEVQQALGLESIIASGDELAGYSETSLPGPNIPPGAVAFPASTEDVKTLVRMANKYRTPLNPISMGQNIGMGGRTAVEPGQVIVDLGRRMQKIIEIDEELGYCVIEPGVTFRRMYDELKRTNSRLMISPTGGPPHGSMLGNAIDRGGGTGAYSDHFGALCGLEVVLGNESVLRTGDGSLDTENAPNWHLSKYSFGPGLDSLFSQSNYGIVTKTGVWLALRPPVIETFVLTFPDDDDLGPLIDLTRQLKMSNFVSSQIRVTNDIYLIAGQQTHPNYKPGTKNALSFEERKELQARHKVGSWTVAGAFYGASKEAIAPNLERVRNHYAKLGKGHFIDSAEADTMPLLDVVRHGFAGAPSENELRMINWRPGGGTTWFLPGIPMIGRVANELHRMTRATCEKYGLEYIVSHSCGARFARGVHTLVFNKKDLDESRRADDCYRDLANEYARRGISVGRAPTRYQMLHQQHRSPAFRAACESIKSVLDPNGIIAPGKYGIGGSL